MRSCCLRTSSSRCSSRSDYAAWHSMLFVRIPRPPYVSAIAPTSTRHNPVVGMTLLLQFRPTTRSSEVRTRDAHSGDAGWARREATGPQGDLRVHAAILINRERPDGVRRHAEAVTGHCHSNASSGIATLGGGRTGPAAFVEGVEHLGAVDGVGDRLAHFLFPQMGSAKFCKVGAGFGAKRGVTGRRQRTIPARPA